MNNRIMFGVALLVGVVVWAGVFAQSQRPRARLNPALAEALNAEPADVVVEYLLSAMSPAAVDEATAALAARYLVPARERLEERRRRLEETERKLDQGVIVSDSTQDATGAASPEASQ